MQVLRADMADELLDVSNVIIQTELAFFERDHACVEPVRDVHLMVLQKGTHGVAQQRGVMARQRGTHQHNRFIFQLTDGAAIVSEALEAQQTAKRLLDDRLFDDRNVVAVFDDLMDVEFRLFVIFA